MSEPVTSPQAPLEHGRHDKEGRQRALVEAAMRVFAEHGFDAATTREIAERAGVSEGLIHRYFGGKRGLLMAAFEAHTANIKVLAFPPSSSEMGLEEDLEALVVGSLEFMWAQQDFLRVSVSQSVIDPAAGKHLGELLVQARVKGIQALLERHQQSGAIAPEVDLEAVAWTLGGLTFASGFMAQVAFQMDRDYVRRITREAVRIFSRGLRAPDSSHPGGSA